ncbi:MAG TPA: hypothetical protein PKC28_03455 [Bdellovibrionales bacterium]|nr:hypothetical protein [Bdellovibrionales bacterium]
MRVMKWIQVMMLAFTLGLGFSGVSFADDGAGAEMREAGRDLKKGAKKTMRKVQDETCEMVKGKMECLGKKVKHKVQDGVDEVKDKTNAD